jgi:hypothetical protein
MTVESRNAGEDPHRFEAARQAVRALAGAFRTLRLYPLGHELATAALHAAGQAMDAYVASYGMLAFTATPQGVTFDFSPRRYADDVVLDLSRAMRARAAPGLRFLQPFSPGEIGELLSAFHQPVHEVERAGGITKVLLNRGVAHLAIEHVGAGAPALGMYPLEPLLEAAKAGAANRIAAYLEQTAGDHEVIRKSLREFDRRIATWPRAAQASAWKAIGQTLASLRVSWQAGVCAMVVQSVDEPWAASLASQWPPVLAASLAAQVAADAHERGRRVAEVLRSFHRPILRVPLPPSPQLTAAEVRQAAAELEAWPPARLHAQAMRRLLEIPPTPPGGRDRGTSPAAPAGQRAQPAIGGGPAASRQDGPILTRLLIAAVQQVRHYGPQHPMAAESVQRLDAAMREELRRGPVIQWEAAGDWLIAQGAALPDGDRYAQELRRHITSRGIARVTIFPAVNSEGLRTFIRILSREPEELIAAGGIVEAVRSAGVPGVEVDAPTTDVPLPPETDEYREACAAASEIFAAVERGDTSIDAHRVHTAVEPLAVRDDPLPLWRQVVIRAHDELDAAHAVNVAFLTIHITQMLGLGRAEQMGLGIAGFLHDLGMARLTWEERLAERTRSAGARPLRHAAEGGLLLRHVGGPNSLPMLVAMEHHLVFAGDGGELPPHSRLVALADYVDAMTCGRVVGVRPATIGGLLRALLSGDPPVFDPVHVHALVALTGQVSSAGVDVATRG